MGELKLFDFNGDEADLRSDRTTPKHIVVTYSCGSCGYQLNLNSDNRNTTMIGSKYGKWMKKGIMSFWSIDETRFTRVEERRFFRRYTKLLCGKCENHIGIAQKTTKNSRRIQLRKSYTFPANGILEGNKVYEIKIRALQPCSFSPDDSLIFP
ncbi:PREDICTED: uncharacterized protein At4g08330, chloroplastic-like [Tarenaya hassleriana]|uniref:uncharacterized protein At4g08330, chloroplastic-like n=1 Tax=Tarenaya hassleriana TaxID=28532 RepID=UPI00053C3004|nr:PREDICTED: uncharacterized protein At4g08330, chloroplastic-like [Tarenaya hassleriana]